MLKRNYVKTQLEVKDECGERQKKSGLSFLTVQKMIKRFLTCDRIVTKKVRCRKLTERELAKKLSISLSELKVFVESATFARRRGISGEITPPLVKLYCSTKWAKSEHR